MSRYGRADESSSSSDSDSSTESYSESESDSSSVDSDGDSDSSSVDVDDAADARAAASRIARREARRRRTVAYAGPLEFREYVQDRALRTGRPIGECRAVALAERQVLREKYAAEIAAHVPHVEKPKAKKTKGTPFGIVLVSSREDHMAKKSKSKTTREIELSKTDAKIVNEARAMEGGADFTTSSALRDREHRLRAAGDVAGANATRRLRKSGAL